MLTVNHARPYFVQGLISKTFEQVAQLDKLLHRICRSQLGYLTTGMSKVRITFWLMIYRDQHFELYSEATKLVLNIILYMPLSKIVLGLWINLIRIFVLSSNYGQTRLYSVFGSLKVLKYALFVSLFTEYRAQCLMGCLGLYSAVCS